MQGQLKPANVLVVSDQLKLASDTIRTAGETRVSVAEPSPYDPPEAERQNLSPAGDIWALGITMVEALTQRLPASTDESSAAAGLPATLAPTLADAIHRCLSQEPAARPTAADLEALFKRRPQSAEIPVPQAVAQEILAPPPPAGEPAHPRALMSIVATILILLGAGWLGLRLSHRHSNPGQALSGAVQPPSQPPVGTPPVAPQAQRTEVPASAEATAPLASAKPRGKPASPVLSRPVQPAQPSTDTPSSVVHEQLPLVPHSALQTIHGHVKVAVLVIVDPSGKVVDALVENAGPSAYFARLAREAARNWQFAPTDTQDSREWLLRFEFSRGGATAHAAPRRS